MRRALPLLLAAAALLAPPAADAVPTLQPIGSYAEPLFVTSDPADPDRLLIVERAGRIILQQGSSRSTFLNLASAGLVSTEGERGLYSVALAPNFSSTGRLYVYYTTAGSGNARGDLQLDEYTASGDSAAVATRRPVLTIEHSSASNHNGGQLQFGPDGFLYMATGDGGGGGDPDGNGQNLETLLGKMLRIDPRPAGSAPYGVPPTNPFVGVPRTRPEIWSYGLRNPFRFSFDRAGGALTIGDVGQGAWEEIDFASQPDAGRGVNYGWNACEASFVYPPALPPQPCPSSLGATNPVHQYPHSGNPSGCSITGGYVSRDPGVAQLYGRYLYTDLCAGQIRSVALAVPLASGDRSENLSVDGPGSFGQDSCGRVYVTSLGTGQVFRIADSAAPTNCTAPTEPTPPPLNPSPPPSNPKVPPTCGGKTATIVPGASGTEGDDVIAGSEGDGAIRGRGGNDTICGFEGRDVLRGGPGDDVLRGGPGRDRCRGGGGRDVLRSC